MEICGIDMMEAYHLYENANHSFETAVNMQLGKGMEEASFNSNSLDEKKEDVTGGNKQYQAQDFD